jgi:hypothetical protein
MKMQPSCREEDIFSCKNFSAATAARRLFGALKEYIERKAF